ncbi:hypothetical protein ATANTOWER_023874 [Ataeniobius toweri]|uniref:Uncharacterized protein n=1 Tax=Ataeniobius toweri TaxID=208326 RepID=A0ABU7BUG3_9TELE|nr:hypothetical protein [Ataeniobius toweri]
MLGKIFRRLVAFLYSHCQVLTWVDIFRSQIPFLPHELLDLFQHRLKTLGYLHLKASAAQIFGCFLNRVASFGSIFLLNQQPGWEKRLELDSVVSQNSPDVCVLSPFFNDELWVIVVQT